MWPTCNRADLDYIEKTIDQKSCRYRVSDRIWYSAQPHTVSRQLVYAKDCSATRAEGVEDNQTTGLTGKTRHLHRGSLAQVSVSSCQPGGI